MSSLTLVSRFFGFIRDMLIANKLGTSAASDAFFVALMLPNLLRRLFAEGAFNVVFVPILSRIQSQEGHKAAEKFASHAYTALAIVLLIITLLAEFFMEPLIANVLARGWVNDPERLNLAVTLTRITFPYLMLITFASLAGGICNTYGKFGPFAIAPVLLNFSFIGGLLLLPIFGIDPTFAAAYAMTFGGILQMAYMAHALKKIKFNLHLSKKIDHPEMGNLLKRLGPAALGIGVLQISFLVDILLASYLEDNAVSYLQFANRFYQQPLSLIGIALATVLLPHLSKALKQEDKREANKSYTDSLLYGSSLALFSTIVLIALAFPLIDALFAHGEFTVASAHNVANALTAYCLALPAYVVTKITVTCFYARGDTTTPLKVSALTLVLNIILNLVLMQKYGYLGLALATSISGWVNALLQKALLHKQGFIHINERGPFWRKVGLSFVINFAVLGTVYIIHHIFPYPENLSTIIQIGWIMFIGLSAFSVFVLSAHLLKFFNMKDVLNTVIRRKKHT